MLRYCISLLVLGFLAFVERMKAQHTTSFSVTSLSKGHPAVYSFSFETKKEIIYESAFWVAFPDGFQDVSHDFRCVVMQEGEAPLFAPCKKQFSNPLTISVSMERIDPSHYTLYLADVINPSNFPSTVGFNVTTVLGKGIVEEIIEFEGIPLLDLPISLNDLQIQPVQNQSISVGESFTLTVNVFTTNNHPPGSSFTVILPKSFQFREPQVEALDINSQYSSLAGIISIDKRRLLIKAYPYTIRSRIPLKLTISNVFVTGEQFSMNSDFFRFEINHPEYPQTLESSQVTPQIVVNPQQLNVQLFPSSVKNDSYFVGEINFRIHDFLYSSGQIFIYFDQQIRLRKTECQISSGIIGGECRINNFKNRIEIDSFTEANPHEDIVVLFKALSSDYAGVFNVTVESKDKRKSNILGIGSTSLEVTQEESFVIFRALMTNPSIMPNEEESTLLYFTFKFFDPLPPSNITTMSKITLEISPAIPNPSKLLKKELKCMFLMVTESPECTWNNTLNDRTVINIKLPTFQIPSYLELEISAYDKENNEFLGIPVLPRDINYEITVTTSLNNIVQNRNVYRTNFIPMAKELPDSVDASLFTKEAERTNGMILTFAAPRSLIRGKDYHLTLDFLNERKAWSSKMGYESEDEIYDYPCWILGKADNEQLHCTLHTGNTGSNPKIRVYGIGDLSNDGLVEITFPKLELSIQGLNQDIEIRIEIQESIPSVLDNYPSPITLFYKNIHLGNVLYVSNAVPIRNNFQVSFDSSTPTRKSAGTIWLYDLSSNPSIIVTSLHQGGILANNEYGVNSGVYVSYGLGVDRVIFYRRASYGSNLTLSMYQNKTLNPLYEGPLEYQSALYSDGEFLKIYSTSFTFASFIEIHSFEEVPTGVYILEGESNLFITRFSLNLGNTKSLIWEFLNTTIADETVPYCKFSSNVLPADVRGVICERISDKKIKISNFLPFPNISLNIEAILKLIPHSGYDSFKIYSLDGENRVIEKSNFHNFNLSMTPKSSDVQDFRLLRVTVQETNVWLNEPFYFQITGDQECFKVRLIFPINATITSGNRVCLMNGTISQCIVQEYPRLSITFISTTPITSSTSFQFQVGDGPLSTGVDFNLSPGIYELSYELLDVNDNIKNVESIFLLFYPQEPESFDVKALVTNGNFEDTIWKFTVVPNMRINGYSGAANQGRIKFMLHTRDGEFHENLVHQYPIPQFIPCTTQGLFPLPFKSIKCKLIPSQREDFPATIEVINFAQIAAGTSIEVKVAGIWHHTHIGDQPDVTLLIASVNYPFNRGILSNFKRVDADFFVNLSPITLINETNSTLPIYVNKVTLGEFDPSNRLNIYINSLANGISRNSLIQIILPENIDYLNSSIVCSDFKILNCEVFNNNKIILITLAEDIFPGQSTFISVEGFKTTHRIYANSLTIRKHIIINDLVTHTFLESYNKVSLRPLVNEILNITVTPVGLSSHSVDVPRSKSQYIEVDFTLLNGPETQSMLLEFQIPEKVVMEKNQEVISRTFISQGASELFSKIGSTNIPAKPINNGSALLINNFKKLGRKNARVRLLIPVQIDEEQSLNVRISTFASQANSDENPIESGSFYIPIGNQYGINAKTTSKVFANRVLRAGDRIPIKFKFSPARYLDSNSTILISFKDRSLSNLAINMSFTSSLNIYSLVYQSQTNTIIPSRISVIDSNTLKLVFKAGLERIRVYSIEIGTYNDIDEDQFGFNLPNIVDTVWTDFNVHDPGLTLLETISLAWNLKPNPFFSSKVHTLNLNANSSDGVLFFAFTPSNSGFYQEVRLNLHSKFNDDIVENLLEREELAFYSVPNVISSCHLLGEFTGEKALVTLACTINQTLNIQEHKVFVDFQNSILKIDGGEEIIDCDIMLSYSNGTNANYDYIPDFLVFKENIPADVIAFTNLSTVEIGQVASLTFNFTDLTLFNDGYLVIAPNYLLRIREFAFGCSPNCTVQKIGNQILLIPTFNIDVGTLITVSGLVNPPFVVPILGVSYYYSSSRSNRASRIQVSSPSDLGTTFIPQSASNYNLTVTALDSNRRSLTAVEFIVEGNFIGSSSALLSWTETVPYSNVQCFQSQNSDVSVTSCVFNKNTKQLKVVFSNSYTGNYKLALYVLISLVPENTQRNYTISSSLQLFQEFDFSNLQFSGNFPDFQATTHDIEDYSYDNNFKVFTSPSFYNKKKTLSDPNCCHWIRFLIFMEQRAPNNLKMVVKLLNDHLQYPPYPANTSTLCYVNNLYHPCIFTNHTTHIEFEMTGINYPSNDCFDVQLGFRNPQTGQLSGFYIDTQTSLQVGVELYNSSNSFISNMLSEFMILKPDRLSKFKIRKVLTLVKNQINAIEFVVNAHRVMTINDQIRLVLEFEVGNDKEHYFEENLGSYTDGSLIPCLQRDNMEVDETLKCTFVAGHDHGKYSSNAKIYIESFSIIDPALDFSFIVAGFRNPNYIGSRPTFFINLYTKNNYKFLIKGFNELYNGIRIEDSNEVTVKSASIENQFDLDGCLYNKNAKYLLTIDTDLSINDSILMILGENFDRCFFKENYMTGIVEGKLRRVVWTHVAFAHQGGNKFKFNTFVCNKFEDDIQLHIYQYSGVKGEIQTAQFPEYVGFASEKNEIVIRNPSDMIVSLIVTSANVNNVRTIGISALFSNSFFDIFNGFYPTQYGMIAVVKFSNPIFDTVFTCFASNGVLSTSLLYPLNCRVNRTTQELIITNFDRFVLLDRIGNTLGLRIRAKLNQNIDYNSLQEKLHLQLYYDQFAFENNYEFLFIRREIGNVAFLNRRMLAPTANSAILKNKTGNVYLIDFIGQGTIFTQYNDYLQMVTLTFLGDVSNISTVEMRMTKPTISSTSCLMTIQNKYECILDQNVMRNFVGTFEFSIEPITITKSPGTLLFLDQKSVLVTLEKTLGQKYYYMVKINKDPGVDENDNPQNPPPQNNTNNNNNTNQTNNTGNPPPPVSNGTGDPMCRLANQFNVSILGDANYTIFEVFVRANNLSMNILNDNVMVLVFSAWNFSIFNAISLVPRLYPCRCNRPVTCYYYPPNSVYGASPFEWPSIYVDFGIDIMMQTDLQCHFPVLRQQGASRIRTLLLSNQSAELDENENIFTIAECDQSFNGPTLAPGDPLDFTISLAGEPGQTMNITLTTTVGQFKATDIIYINLGETIIYGTQNENLVCQNLTDCRIYDVGSLLIVGNPSSDVYDLVIPNINYTGYFDDGYSNILAITVHDRYGRLRNIEKEPIPNQFSYPLNGSIILQNFRPWRFGLGVFELKFNTGPFVIQVKYGGYILLKDFGTFVQFHTDYCAAYVEGHESYFDYHPCIIENDTIRISCSQGEIEADHDITVIFHAKILDDIPENIMADFYIMKMNNYTRLLNARINIQEQIKALAVLPDVETGINDIHLLEMVRVGEVYRDGPLMIQFQTGYQSFDAIKLKAFNIGGYYPICWLNEINSTTLQTPIANFRLPCVLFGDQLLISYDFTILSTFQIEITFTQNPDTNNLLDFAHLTNFAWNNILLNEIINVEFLNNGVVQRSGSSVIQQSRQLGQNLKILAASVTSNIPIYPKAVSITLRFNQTIQASSDSFFDIVFPERSYNGYFDAWVQDGSLLSPPVNDGDFVDCSAHPLTSTVPLNPTYCVFLVSDGVSPRIRIPFPFAVAANAPVYLAVYNIMGPDSTHGMAGIEIEFHSRSSLGQDFLLRTFIETLVIVDPNSPPIAYSNGSFTLLRTDMRRLGAHDVDATATITLNSQLSVSNIDAILEPPGGIWNFDPNTISFKIDGVEGVFLGFESQNQRYHYRFNGVSINSNSIMVRLSRYNHSEEFCNNCVLAKLTVLERGQSIKLVSFLSYPNISSPVLSFVDNNGWIEILSWSQDLHSAHFNINMTELDPRTTKLEIQLLSSQIQVYGVEVGNLTNGEFSQFPARVFRNDDSYSIELLTTIWRPAVFTLRVIGIVSIPRPDFRIKFKEYHGRLLKAIDVENDQVRININNALSILQPPQFSLTSWRNLSIGEIPRETRNEHFYDRDQMVLEISLDYNLTSNSQIDITIPDNIASPNLTHSHLRAAYIKFGSIKGESDDRASQIILPTYVRFNDTTRSLQIGGPVSGQVGGNFVVVISNWNERVLVFDLIDSISFYIGLKITTPTKTYHDVVEHVRYNGKPKFSSITLTRKNGLHFNFRQEFGPIQLNISNLNSIGFPSSENKFVKVRFPWLHIGDDGLDFLQRGRVKGVEICDGIDNDCDGDGLDDSMIDFGGNGDQYLYVKVRDLANSLNLKFPAVQNPSSPRQFIAEVEHYENIPYSFVPRVVAKKTFVLQENLPNLLPHSIIPELTFTNFTVGRNGSLSFSFVNPGQLEGETTIELELKRSVDCISKESLNNASINGYSLINYIYDSNSFHFFTVFNGIDQGNVNFALNSNLQFLNSQCQVSGSLKVYNGGNLKVQGESELYSSEVIQDSNSNRRGFGIVHGNPEVGHNGIYRLRFVTQYSYPALSSLEITLPFHTAEPNLLIYSYCYVRFGLTDASNDYIDCSFTGSNTLEITGFGYIPQGQRIVIEIGANPRTDPFANSGTLPVIHVKSPQYKLPHAVISGFSPLHFSQMPFGRYYNRTVFIEETTIYPGLKQNLVFMLTTYNPIVFNPADSNSIEIVIDSAFVINPRAIIRAYIRRANSSSTWIGFNGILYSQFPNSHLRFRVENISQFEANSSYYIRLNIEANEGNGILIPPPGDYYFHFSVIANGTLQNTFPSILKVLPRPEDDVIMNHNPLIRESSRFTYVDLTGTFGIKGMDVGDEIWIEYPLRNNLGMLLYDKDLGFRAQESNKRLDRDLSSTAGTSRAHIPINCHILHNSTIVVNGGCVLLGGRDNDQFAVVKIRPNIQASNSSQIKVIFGQIQNPPITLYRANLRISFKRQCRNDGREHCTVSSFLSEYTIQQKSSMNDAQGTLSVQNNQVSEQSQYGFNNFPPLYDWESGDYITVVAPSDFNHNGQCRIDGLTQECYWFQNDKVALIKLTHNFTAQISHNINLQFTNRPLSCAQSYCSDLFVVSTISKLANRFVHHTIYNIPVLRILEGINPVINALPNRYQDSSNSSQSVNSYKYWVNMKMANFFDGEYVDTLEISVSNFVFDTEATVNATLRVLGTNGNADEKYPDVFKAKFINATLLSLKITKTHKLAALSQNEIIVHFRINKNSNSQIALFNVLSLQSQNRLIRRNGQGEVSITGSINNNSSIPLFDLRVVKNTIVETNGNDLVFSLHPLTSDRINRITIDLPQGFTGQFVTNTSFQCSLVGLPPWVVKDCFNDQSQRNGNTIFINLNGYNNENTTLLIKGQTPFFIAPAEPSPESFAILKLFFDSELKNEFRLSFNSFLKEGVQNMQIKSLFHHSIMSPVEITFDSPPHSIIPGDYAPNSNISSRIIIEFPEHSGWDNSLGVSHDVGENIDCIALNYEEFLGELECELHRGNFEENAQIHLKNYGRIPSNTTGISILIGDILLPFNGFEGSVIVKIDYFQKYFKRERYPAHESVYFQLSGLQNTPLPAFSQHTLEVQGSTESTSVSTLIFNFELPMDLDERDEVELLIDEKLFDREVSTYNFTINFDASIYIFPSHSTVLLRNFTNGISSGVKVWRLGNVPKVPYTFNSTVSVKMRIIKNRNIALRYDFSRNVATIPTSSFEWYSVNFSSLTGGDNDKEFTIELVTGFTLHENASFVFSFPEIFGNFRVLEPGCTTNMNDKLSCEVHRSDNSAILLSLFQGSISPLDTLIITLSSMNIPNVDLSSLGLNLQIFYSQDLDSIVSDANASFPQVNISSAHTCYLNVSTRFQTPEIVNDMTFGVQCSTIKKNTILEIEFPRDYLTSLPSYFVECDSQDILLLSSYCEVVPGNFIVIKVPLEATPFSSSFYINIRDVRNPLPGTYLFGMKAVSNFFVYGEVNQKPSLVFGDFRKFNRDPLIYKAYNLVPRTPSEVATHIAFTGRFNYFEQAINVHIKLSREFILPNQSHPLSCAYYLYENYNDAAFDLNQFKDILYRSYATPCSMVARSVIIPISDSVKNQNNNVAWIIKGIRNPSSYISIQLYVHYELPDNQIIWQRPVTIPTSTWNRPIGVRVNWAESDDYNLGVTSTMKVALLPFGNESEETENTLHLSSDFIENQNNTEISCSNSQTPLQCSNVKLDINFKLQSQMVKGQSFILGISNLINPSTSPECVDNQDVPALINGPHAPFNLSFFGIQSMSMLYKAYSIINNKNLCLNYKQVRAKITIEGSSVVYSGINYHYTVRLARCTTDLVVKISTSNLRVQITPSTLVFDDLYMLEQKFTVGFPFGIPNGEIVFNFEKIDPFNDYEEIPPLIVFLGLPRDAPKKQVFLHPIASLENNNMTQFLNFYLEDYPAVNVPVIIDKGNHEGVYLSHSNFSFTPQSKNFTVVIRVLPSERDVFILNIRVNQTGVEIPFEFTQSPLQIEIINGRTFGTLNFTFTENRNITKNSISFEVCFNKPAISYAAIAYVGSPPPSSNELIGHELAHVVQQRSSKVTNTEEGQACTIYSFDNLEAQTRYTVFVQGYDEAIYTSIESLNFQTEDLSEGVIFGMYFRGNQSLTQIIKCLSLILNVKPSRIISLGVSTYNTSGAATRDGFFDDEQLRKYEFILAPDERNDAIPPSTIVQRLNSPDSQTKLKREFSGYVGDLGFFVRPYTQILPSVIIEPVVWARGYYNVTFKVQLSGPGQLFGVRIPSHQINGTFNTKQIYKGLKSNNYQFETKYFASRARSRTDFAVLIYFDDCRDEDYEFFFIVGDAKLYDPPTLAGDSHIMRYSLKAVDNPFAVSRT